MLAQRVKERKKASDKKALAYRSIEVEVHMYHPINMYAHIHMVLTIFSIFQVHSTNLFTQSFLFSTTSAGAAAAPLQPKTTIIYFCVCFKMNMRKNLK